MTRDRFGQDIDIFEEVLRHAMVLTQPGRDDPSKRLEEWDIPYFLSMIYDMVFEISERAYIYDELTNTYKHKRFEPHNAPLRMVSMSARTGLLENGPFATIFDQYRIYDIHKFTGLSLTEWLELPTFYTESILRTLQREKRLRDAKIAEDKRLLTEGQDTVDQIEQRLKGGSRYN